MQRFSLDNEGSGPEPDPEGDLIYVADLLEWIELQRLTTNVSRFQVQHLLLDELEAELRR